MRRLGILSQPRYHRQVPSPVQTVVSPYFTPKSPTSGEASNYNRSPKLYYWTVNTFTWTWQFSGLTPAPALWPSVRALVDGVPASDWLNPTSNSYTFSLTVANGHHLISFEIQSRVPDVQVTTNQVMCKDFIVNTTGVPLPTQAPWTAINRFDRSYVGMANGALQVTYPGSPIVPTAWPLKARPIEPYSTVLTGDQLWVRRTNAVGSLEYTRRFVLTPTGDVAIELDQKYTYGANTGPGLGLTAPRMTLKDGPRMVGTLGQVSKVIVRRGGSYYLLDTCGRLCSMTRKGDIETIVGWRVKLGQLKAHGGMIDSLYMRAQNPTFYEGTHEHLGNWAVSGPARFHEPRGFAVAKRNLDDSIDTRDGREFYICDRLNDRILYVNARTMDAPEDYEPPHFPPPGYIAPDEPTGAADVMVFVSDFGDTETVDEPWDCAINPDDGKLYWTCYKSGRIRRINLDGTGLETVFQGVSNPTDATLGLSEPLALASSIYTLATMRSTYLIDGPIGTARCTRPEAFGINSAGKLVWTERHTYALRQLDMATSQVSTLALLSVSYGSSGSSDIGMSIDTEGTCGPVDDIFCKIYKGDNGRYSSTGTYRGQWDQGTNDTLTGPLNLTDAQGYSFCVGVGDGTIFSVGNNAAFGASEITKRQATDPDCNLSLYLAGEEAYYRTNKNSTHRQGPAMGLAHGPRGFGELGFPTFEDLGSYDDATLSTYLQANNIDEADVPAVIYYIRYLTVDIDYS